MDNKTIFSILILLLVGIQPGYASGHYLAPIPATTTRIPGYAAGAAEFDGILGADPAADRSLLVAKDASIVTSDSVVDTNIEAPHALTTRAGNSQPCNNYIEFCDRSYGNITEVCAHDSMFDVAGNIASDQQFGVISQLNDGVRMLQGQAHLLNGTLHFCHTLCSLLDAGPVQDYFSNVSAWLAANPHDVVTILLVNSDNVSPKDWATAIQNSGLGHYVYTPPKVPMKLTDWPTLGAMISNNTRVVLFMDSGADQAQVPYILDEFSQLWETPFSPTNPSFPCTVQRPANLSNADASDILYMLNHNLDVELDPSIPSLVVPDLANMSIINGVSGFSSLGSDATNCKAMWERPPNFLLVDFYNRGKPNGSVFEVAASLNGVSYTRSCCGSSTAISSATSTPSLTISTTSAISGVPTSGAPTIFASLLSSCVAMALALFMNI